MKNPYIKEIDLHIDQLLNLLHIIDQITQAKDEGCGDVVHVHVFNNEMKRLKDAARKFRCAYQEGVRS